MMTLAGLDPFGKIPEFEDCAVRVRAGGTPEAAAGYGTGAVPATMGA